MQRTSLCFAMISSPLMIVEEWYCPTIHVGWYTPLGHSHIVSGLKSGCTLIFCCCQLRIILLVSGHKRQVYRSFPIILRKIVGMWMTYVTSTKHDMAKGAIGEHVPEWCRWWGVCILPVDSNHHSLLFTFRKTDLSQMTLYSFCCGLPKVGVAGIVWTLMHLWP